MKISTNTTRRFAVGALAASVALGLGLAPAKAEDPEVYRIGAILAMSGKANWYGTVMSQGILQAVEEINAAGGIDGIMLEAVIEDHKSGVAKEGVAALNRMINLYDVQAVLTSFSPPTLAIAPIADEKGIFLINGGGVSTALIGASKYLVHNRSLASDLGRAAATRAHEMGLTKMAQLAWKTDAGESIIAGVEPYWEGLGGTVTATEFAEVGAPNIDTQIAKIRVSNPDFLALWQFTPDPGLALKKAREFGMSQPIIGIEYNEEIGKIAGDAAEGYQYCSDYFTVTDDNTFGQKFKSGYEQRYGESPEFYAANYYEGVYVIAELIRRAKAQGGDYYKGSNLMDQLKADPTFDSVYGGQMTFQDNGVAKKPVALFEVSGGESTFQKYIEIQ